MVDLFHEISELLFLGLGKIFAKIFKIKRYEGLENVILRSGELKFIGFIIIVLMLVIIWFVLKKINLSVI
ncbi:MAG: hypothetical protein IAE65_03085 [Ignavibacteria bacterium]|nr:hypothetical protein [Ignavibacteria bacterium]